MPGVPGALLDHVAIAVEDWTEAWPRYAGGLGGRWASGGANVGFAPAQLVYANGARLEVLQPWPPGGGGFLRRFLDRSGRGPHHVTFKVPDLGAALEAAAAAGFTPVSIDLSDPNWKEAFLHPRQATGIVVQLAQAAGSWESPAPEGFPAALPEAPAAFSHVTHAVSDIDAALALFGELLGGRVDRVDSATAVLRWDGPLAIRLVSPSPPGDPQPAGPARALAEWIGGRPGRLHHLAFTVPPSGEPVPEADGGGRDPVPGVLPGEHVGRLVVPEDNLGTRLVLLDASPPAATEPAAPGR